MRKCFVHILKNYAVLLVVLALVCVACTGALAKGGKKPPKGGGATDSDTTTLSATINAPNFLFVRVSSSLDLGDISPDSADGDGDVALVEAGEITAVIPDSWGFDGTTPPVMGKIYKADNAIGVLVVSSKPYTLSVSAAPNTGSSNLPSSHLMIETDSDGTMEHLDTARTITGAGTAVNPGQSGISMFWLDVAIEVPAFIDTNLDHVIDLENETEPLTAGTFSSVLTFNVSHSS